jgi:hypothetical protein
VKPGTLVESTSFDFFSLRNSDSRLRVKIPLSFLHYTGISDSCGACQFAADVARENS